MSPLDRFWSDSASSRAELIFGLVRRVVGTCRPMIQQGLSDRSSSKSRSIVQDEGLVGDVSGQEGVEEGG